ncbi:hypothetical protein [Sphingomonas sp.]|uniref:hypothetical protein n=1 Tax=Sphingomonas sp. TaxID=28214 RepID=UPI0035BBD8C2
MSEKLRPTLILRCDYDAVSLGDRMLAMLALAPSKPTIAMVERQFGVPEIATAFDAARSVSYSVQLIGPDDSWHVQFMFRESFFPTDAARRPRFRGGARPMLIDPHIRGEIRFDLDVLGPPQVLATKPCPLNVDRLERRARRQGWRRSHVIEFSSDIVVPPRVSYQRGHALVGGRYDARGCFTDFTLSIEADRRAS